MYGVNLHQALAGRKSIGAIATAKVQSDALNLGFPSAYQSVYAAKGIPERFFNTQDRMAMPMWAGDDLQAQYHQQKKVDADYMAGAKVRATQLSRMRYVGTPHGRGLLPHAVLGQRIFANINNGAFSATSARQSHPDAPYHYSGGGDYTSEFRGGVLRSPQGQAHGMSVLRARVGQLNDIEAAAASFTSGAMPESSGISTQTFGRDLSAASPAIELNLLLQSVQDALVQGTGGDPSTRLDKFDLATAARALGLIFRMVPDGNAEFVEDTQAKVQNILELLNGMLDDETESAGFTATARETALSLQVLFTKLNTYLTKMISGAPVQRQETRFNPLSGQQEVQNVLSQQQGADLSNPERVALSKSLVSSLGFSKMLKYAVTGNDSGLLDSAARNRLFSAQQGQRFRVGDMDSEGGDDDDDGDFDRPEGPREDDAHDEETGVARGDRNFDEDERQVFGMNSGMFFPRNGRGEDEYFGEAEPQSQGAPPTAATDQRRGHRNRDSSSVAQASTDRVRGRFDRETGEYGLDVAPPRVPYDFAAINDPPPIDAQSIPSSRRSIRARARRGISEAAAEVMAASSPIPTRQRDLPDTREEFAALAKRIKEAGGPSIRVYSGYAVDNIRRNFIKRLGLQNKP